MSTFDPAVFENAVFEQASATEWTPLPAGVYTCVIDNVRVKSVKTSQGERPVLEVNHKVMDPSKELMEAAGKAEGEDVLIRQDIWLDVNSNGSLAFGPNQNVPLGRLRAVVGLNKPGKPFSFPALAGQGPLKVHLDVVERDDKKYNSVLKVESAR